MATTDLDHAYAEFQARGFALVDGIFDAPTAATFTELQAEVAAEWRAAADAGRMGLDGERGLPSPHAGHAAHKLLALEVLRRGGEPLLRAVENPSLLALAAQVLGAEEVTIDTFSCNDSFTSRGDRAHVNGTYSRTAASGSVGNQILWHCVSPPPPPPHHPPHTSAATHPQVSFSCGPLLQDRGGLTQAERPMCYFRTGLDAQDARPPFGNARLRPVYLVDNNHGGNVLIQSLPQNIGRLRHRAINGVH